MQRFHVLNQVLTFSAFYIFTTMAQAGLPMWGFTANGNPAVMVSAAGTVSISYTINNNSKKPHRLVLSSKTPTGISQSGSPCVLAAKSPSNPNPTCTLNLKIKGSALPANTISGGPYLCEANSNDTPNPNRCYQANSANALTITRIAVPGATTLNSSIPSPSTLTLSVKNPSMNPGLTGNPRIITITNTGSESAVDLNVDYHTPPGGTTLSTTCGSFLAAGATCSITVIPGANPTSNCNTGIVPIPDVITVSATNVATVTTNNVMVLGYGCQYQGGFLYSIDDTTPNTGNIGGKVLALVDQAEPFTGGPQVTSTVWGSDGSTSTDVSYDTILGIDDISTTSAPSPTAPAYPMGTPAYTACDGLIDGACNSNNIIAYYDFNRTSGGAAPTPLNYYAAGVCKATINGYSDWYLPAICEIDAVFGAATCPAEAQSVVANIGFIIGDQFGGSPNTSCSPPAGTECLGGYYWSSTESANTPSNNAWSEYFNISSSNQGTPDKSYPLGIRCSRAF